MFLGVSFVDDSLLDSTHHPVGFSGGVPSSTESSQSALSAPHYTALDSLDPPGALPSINEPNHEARTADIKVFNHVSPSLIPSDSVSRPTAPQLRLSSDMDGSEQPPTIITSQPAEPLEPPEVAFTNPLADEPYSVILNVNKLNPSSAPLQENKPAHDINILSNSNEILAPVFNVPFIAPHATSPTFEPTDVSPEDFFPTNTMDLDWGSGDYLETMSFLNSDGDDYSLVTKVLSDSYDVEDYTENYDTSFPSRVGIFPTSLHPLHVSPSSSLMTASITTVPHMSTHPSSFSSTPYYTPAPTPTASSESAESSDIDWPDTFTIQPTDVLLPDMNSLEYYTIQLNKENNSSDNGAEHRENVILVPIDTTDITSTTSYTNDTRMLEEESSSDLSGSEPHDESTTVATTVESPQLDNASDPILDPSIIPSIFFGSSSSMWGGQISTTDWSGPTVTAGPNSTLLTEAGLPHVTPLLPDDIMSSSSLTDVHWFVTEPFLQSTLHTTPVLTETIAFSPVPIDTDANITTGTTESTPQESAFTTDLSLNITLVSTEATTNVTLGPPVVLGDQGVTEDGADNSATMTLIPKSSEANTVPAVPTATAITTSHQATIRITATTEASTSVNIISTMSTKTTSIPRQYLCSLDSPAYLIRIGKFAVVFCNRF